MSELDSFINYFNLLNWEYIDFYKTSNKSGGLSKMSMYIV